MGFFRKQEEQLAIRLLKWRYSNSGQAEPPQEMLQKMAAEVVDDAHRIAKQRGRNVLVILKEMLEDMKKR